MANERNLKPFTSEQSREKAVKNGKKGGIKSGESKRKQKALKEIAKSMMNTPIKKGKVRDGLIKEGFTEDDLNSQWPIMIVGLMDAVQFKGNTKAFDKLQELTGNQTDKLLAIKEKELKLKERELELKEKELELKLNNDEDDGVIIINDLYEKTSQDK